MKLEFEVIKDIGSGNYPDVIHLPSNEINVIYLRNGKMRNQIANLTSWDDVDFIDDVQISQDENITHLRVETLGGFGAVGSYKTNDTHKLIIAEYEYDIL